MAEVRHRPEREFPRYMVGLLQNESEMLQAPAYDLSAQLEVDPWFDVELYTERTVRELLSNQDQFDCIVVGYNAAHKSDTVRHELGSHRIRVGLCVLHQFSDNAHAFLAGDLEVSFERLAQGSAAIRPVSQLESDDEILLRWPRELPGEPDGAFLQGAKALYGIVPGGQGAWRAVLDLELEDRRVPVLLRTRTDYEPHAVMCSIMLSPRDEPDHAALLRNLLVWCAAGRPTAVVIGSDATTHPRLTHRKMHLQGARAVAQHVPERPDFRAWPIRGTRDVVLPASLDPTTAASWPHEDRSGARDWLRAGGRIAVLGDDGSLTLRHGESDVAWTVRRWAAWFHSVPDSSWHGGRHRTREGVGSIVATRSVLRVLAALSGADSTSIPTPGACAAARALAGTHVAAADLGVQPPRDFAEPVRLLLESRIGSDDNVDSTVTATTAALDIDALVGGVVKDAKRAELCGWLRRIAGSAAIDDRLEIARCLQSVDILQDAVARLAREYDRGRPLSAVRVSALRAAVVACGLTPDDRLARSAADVIPAAGENLASLTVVDRELRMSALLAATYLLSVCDLRAFWANGPDVTGHPLIEPPEEIVDRAVITLGRLGPLVRGTVGAGDTASTELVCTEALALIGYFGVAPSPTHVLAGVEAVPPQLLSSVLVESEGLRRENAAVDRLSRRERRATNVIGILGCLLVAAAVAAVVLLTKSDLNVLELAVVASGVALVGGLGTLSLLLAAQVEPRWAKRLAATVPANRDELVDGLKSFLTRDHTTGRPRNGR